MLRDESKCGIDATLWFQCDIYYKGDYVVNDVSWRSSRDISPNRLHLLFVHIIEIQYFKITLYYSRLLYWIMIMIVITDS